MIPKILHQVWFGNDIPNTFIQWRKRWRELHQDWDYCLWTEQNTKHLSHLLDNCKSLSSKSNVVRIYSVLTYGGVYADFDVEWNKSLNPLLHHPAFVARETPSRFCNAIFGAEQNNKWLKYQFDLLPFYTECDPPWGPELMTHAFYEQIEHVHEVPSIYFYPYLWGNKYKPAYEFPNSYAVHHWSMSWRKELSTQKQIRQKISEVVEKSQHTQMSFAEYEEIAKSIGDKNLLVFGCGYDSDLWRLANPKGKTIFLEHDPRWLQNQPDVFQVKYTTNISQADKIINDVPPITLPREVEREKWDVILVDGPTGYSPYCHGRMQSIFAASKLATPNTIIYVHDCDRVVEDKYTKHFFSIINQIGKLRKCQIK